MFWQTRLSAPGGVKSIIDPRTCVNMHNHFCWGFVSKNMRHHDVDPDVAVLQHYKRCQGTTTPAGCRDWFNVTYTDTTALKYRAQLASVVSQKLAIFT